MSPSYCIIYVAYILVFFKSYLLNDDAINTNDISILIWFKSILLRKTKIPVKNQVSKMVEAPRKPNYSELVSFNDYFDILHSQFEVHSLNNTTTCKTP